MSMEGLGPILPNATWCARDSDDTFYVYIGYLFNKLEKLQNIHDDATYQYYDVMQWSTGEAYRRATMKAM